MAQKIPWDIQEAVILLNALIAVQEGRITRKEAIQSVSSELRARAVKNGILIDEIFRNINGVRLQMAQMECTLTEDKRGIKNSAMPKLFRNVVALYRNNRAAYEEVLKEARNIPEERSRQDIYFAWLASHVSSTQVPKLHMVYANIENFCLTHGIITQKLFELTNLVDLHKVIETVQSNRVFRFTYKRSLDKIKMAMRLYNQFIRENPTWLESSHQVPEEAEPKPEPIPIEAKKATSTAILVETETEKKTTTSEPGATVSVATKTVQTNTADEVVDFALTQSFAFTQPTEFFYERQGKVCSWSQLYVQVVACLLDDYPTILRAYLNGNFNGQERYDFADETGVSSMIAPKKVKDNFYLETNLSATAILQKIKKLLELCQVDNEKLIIHYQRNERKGCTEAVKTPIQSVANANQMENPDISRNRIQFIEWMKQSDMTVHTISNYVSAIKRSGKLANECGICHTDLLLIQDADQLTKIQAALLHVPDFQELDRRQHNRFRAALTQLIAFRSASLSASRQLSPVSSTAPPAAPPEPPIIPEPTVKATSFERSSIMLPEELRARYTAILTEYFGENGYQLKRAISRGRFKRYYEQKYGCAPMESDERIDAILSAVGVKRDGRIFPKQESELLVPAISNEFCRLIF